MIKCKNCKFWKLDIIKIRGKEHQNIYGTCIHRKFVYDEDGIFYLIKKNIPLDCLMYYDSEGFSAGFLVGRNFGCIHGRVKKKWEKS